MQAGKLRNRVSVQTKTVTYDSYGEPVETWAHDRYLKSEVIDRGGGEFYAAQKIYADVKAVFRVRQELDATITKQDRLVWDSRTFEILSVTTDGGRRRELLLPCREVT